MYNPKSDKAEEFINHEEILATLEYAAQNKHNTALIDKILTKARQRKGLCAKVCPIVTPPYCLIATFQKKTPKFLLWPNKLKMISTATALSCLRRCTYQTIA